MVLSVQRLMERTLTRRFAGDNRLLNSKRLLSKDSVGTSMSAHHLHPLVSSRRSVIMLHGYRLCMVNISGCLNFYFISWNYLSSIGSGITLICWFYLFGFILYPPETILNERGLNKSKRKV
jgi:hypothetical protein